MTNPMSADALVEALCSPAPWGGVAPDEVFHTHLSVVFLVGERAYKLKKPLDLGFVDQTDPDRRRALCHDEVRLNRRLAPDVYLGVVPVGSTPDGVRVGEGEPVDHLVMMRRLDHRCTLLEMLDRGEVTPELLARVATAIADFHRTARRDATWTTLAVVRGNALDNLRESAPHVGRTLSPEVAERFTAVLGQHLDDLAPVIEARASQGLDGHGDLRLDHVYVEDDGIRIVDCVEFSDRFRVLDPASDVAFLAMELGFAGRSDLARGFLDAWVAASGDGGARKLFSFYLSYRSAVRAKVRGFLGVDAQAPAAQREQARRTARAHWLFALGALEAWDRRPALVLVGGLPGVGKTTLARGLAAAAGFEVVRSDVVRKQLVGVEGPARAAFGRGIYADDWTDRTYAACMARAREVLWRGGRVCVDASFSAEHRRRAFLEIAQSWGVPGIFVECAADPEVVRGRLARRRGDASDADWRIHQALAAKWDPLAAGTARHTLRLDTGAPVDEAVARAVAFLRARWS